MKVRDLKRRKMWLYRRSDKFPLSWQRPASMTRVLIGVARDQFEVPDSIDTNNLEITRLFAGGKP